MLKFDLELQNWIKGSNEWNTRKKTKEAQLEEYIFACKYMHFNTKKQWSSSFGEKIVENLIYASGESVWVPQKKIGIKADLETSHAYYEVKTRNWSTSGTAGEKILGAPYKYRNFTKYTGKKLYIVLVGFQEYEAVQFFGLFNTDKRAREFTELCTDWNIYFMKCSDLLKNLPESGHL